MNSAEQRRAQQEFHDALIDEMWEGYEDFTKEITERIRLKNLRTYRALYSLKGIIFTEDFIAYLTLCKCDGLITISRETIGFKVKEDRIRGIDHIFLEAYSMEGGMHYTVFVPVKEGRWLQFSFFQ